MKYKGYLTSDGVLLSNKKIKGLDYSEEKDIDLLELTHDYYPFRDFKKNVRACKEKRITLSFCGHTIRLSKKHLGKFLNQYTLKTAKEVQIRCLGSQSPVLFQINDDWCIIAPIIKQDG